MGVQAAPHIIVFDSFEVVRSKWLLSCPLVIDSVRCVSQLCEVWSPGLCDVSPQANLSDQEELG